jgi:hypothetical protein
MYDNFKFTYSIGRRTKVDPVKIKEVENFFQNEYVIVDGEKIHLDFQDVQFKTTSTGTLTKIEVSDYLFYPSVDGYYGEFEDAKLFALKLSEALVSGHVILRFTNATDGADPWALKVQPNHVYYMNQTFPTRGSTEITMEDVA